MANERAVDRRNVVDRIAAGVAAWLIENIWPDERNIDTNAPNDICSQEMGKPQTSRKYS